VTPSGQATRRALAAIALAVSVSVWLPARAEAQLGVNCTISATPVAFGSYDVLSASPVDSTGTITYECVIGFPIIITLSRGSSSSFTPRTMTSGAETLAYNVYLDAARTTIWGDGTGGTSSYSANTILLPVTVTVYGRVPASQNVAAGSYGDTLVATIIF
jgi:spore coat protein U domain-containing protein, fimbrial subunit CupE1/2/3/6